jgi:hypothetical protein
LKVWGLSVTLKTLEVKVKIGGYFRGVNMNKNILHHQNYFQTYISSNFHRDANNYSWKASFTARKEKYNKAAAISP